MGRSGANPQERTLAPSNASDLQVVWVRQTPGAIEASPTVANGRVYVSSLDGNESAFYASNGTLAWSTFIGQSTFSRCANALPRGTTSVPTIVNDTLYVGGGDPYVYALNASTGVVEWKVSEAVNSPSGGNYNWGSPLVYGTSLYQGLSTACGSPGSEGALIQINLNGTNHSVTHLFRVVPKGSAGGSVWSSPAIDPTAGLVWLTTGDEISAASGYFRSILALNASNLSFVGAWQEPVSGGDYDFGAGPTLFHDGTGRALVAALNKNGVVYALNRTNVSSGSGWNPVWSVNTSWYFNSSSGQAACGCAIAPAAFDGSHLYVGGGFTRFPNGTNASGSVRSIAPENGTIEWAHAAPGVVVAGLAYANGLIVDAADAPTFTRASVEVLDAQSGRALYHLSFNRTVNAAPTVADGRIFVASGNYSMSGTGYLTALGLNLTSSIIASPVPGSWPPTFGFQASVAGGMPPYRSSWSFGDGSTTAAGPSVVHSYVRAGAFQVNLTTSDNASEVASDTFWVNVTDRPIDVAAFLAVPPRVPLGDSVTFEAIAVGGLGPLHFAYANLPPGCLSSNASNFTCVPTAMGQWNASVLVRDDSGVNASAGTSVSVTAPTVRPLSIPLLLAVPSPVQVGQTLTIVASAEGGTPPYAWSYTGLPPGCLGQDAPTFGCTPTQAGRFAVQLSVTDRDARTAAATFAAVVVPASVTPLALGPLEILPNPVRAGDVATLFVTAEGGLGNLTYAYSGLPPGCTSQDRPAWSCHPSQVGRYTIVVRVADQGNQTANRSASLQVDVQAAPIASATAVGPPYGWLVAAFALGAGIGIAGGVAVSRWKRPKGDLPPPAGSN